MSFRRPAIDLDGEWRFIRDPDRLLSPEALPDGEPISVPGCWEAQVPDPYRIVTAWYRRRIRIPADWHGRQVLVRFGAVMYRSTVWVNGMCIGEHEGGYTPFDLAAGHAVRVGEENDVVVRVTNPMNAIDDYPVFGVEQGQAAEEPDPERSIAELPHGKQTWYSSTSGIWQSVRIEAVSTTRLGRLGIRPELAERRALVRWCVVGEPLADLDPEPGDSQSGALSLELILRDPDGEPVGAPILLEVADAGDAAGEVSLEVAQPRAWDIGVPNLYRVDATLLRDGRPVDGLSERFGMRSIAIRDGRVMLNGRPIYLIGALDQDFYDETISTPPSRAFLDRQMRLAREMGLNLLRCHIKAPDPAYLDAADEAGILLWCELPNWSRFSLAAAARGRETLRAMVEAMGNHPSIVIWTIINEDWGTRLRHEARDRQWLLGMVRWLRSEDPTRLVVDNSACETEETPNFHLDTDLADFHLYHGIPDNAVRWRSAVADYARRPAWLWSPHGDARPRGTEPLVLSEFGGWGLPRVSELTGDRDGQPWWFETGHRHFRPAGIDGRFEKLGLDRIFTDLDDLADATQRHQFDGLHFAIGQLRRHDSIGGYVITELTDAYWEANGLLDCARRPKSYHARLSALNAPDAVILDLERYDAWGGATLAAELTLSAYGPAAGSAGGRVEWRVTLDDGQQRSGVVSCGSWPTYGASSLGRVELPLPDVQATCDAQVAAVAYDADGVQRATDEHRIAVLPSAMRRTARRQTLAIDDAMEIWQLENRVAALGHEIVDRGRAEVLITAQVTDREVAWADQGHHLLAMVRSREAIASGLELDRPVHVQLRRFPEAGFPGQRSAWDGDWVTSYSWLLPGSFPGLPRRPLLDLAYQLVLPDHVLLGYDPELHAGEVPAGMFVGWLHAPAALVWSFPQGRGRITLTTLRVSPETGPVPTALLEALIQRAADSPRAPHSRGTGSV
ncbi:MAG: hypothetical protein M3Y88_04180 [Chloroflexota bacterium]|nr:hypothetical protein [Chloroflexota bacterium]